MRFKTTFEKVSDNVTRVVWIRDSESHHIATITNRQFKRLPLVEVPRFVRERELSLIQGAAAIKALRQGLIGPVSTTSLTHWMPLPAAPGEE